MKKQNRLYELMGKINPELKENFKPLDVQNMKDNMDTDTMSKIDNPNEFKDAFKVWFNTLGFDPNENPISRSKIRIDVDRALEELGY